MIAISYTFLCNNPPCSNRVTGELCRPAMDALVQHSDIAQVWLTATNQGWVFGRPAATEHYCSQACRAANHGAKDVAA